MENLCFICLDPKGERFCQCSLVAHSRCLFEYLSINKQPTCPQCRRAVKVTRSLWYYPLKFVLTVAMVMFCVGDHYFHPQIKSLSYPLQFLYYVCWVVGLFALARLGELLDDSLGWKAPEIKNA
jgi:hypothetical protein